MSGELSPIAMVYGTGSKATAVVMIDASQVRSKRWSLRCRERQLSLEDWKILDGSPAVAWHKVALSPEITSGQVELVADGATEATAAFFDAGSPVEKIKVICGSCFSLPSRDDKPTQHRAVLKDTASRYQKLAKPESGIAVFNFWLGDQVYVDAPWTKGLRKTDPVDVAAMKYADAWGLSSGPDGGSGRLHAVGRELVHS